LDRQRIVKRIRASTSAALAKTTSAVARPRAAKPRFPHSRTGSVREAHPPLSLNASTIGADSAAVEPAHPVAAQALRTRTARSHPIAHCRSALTHHALFTDALQARALRAVEDSVRPRTSCRVGAQHLLALRPHLLTLGSETLGLIGSQDAGTAIAADGILHLQHPLAGRASRTELLALDRIESGNLSGGQIEVTPALQELRRRRGSRGNDPPREAVAPSLRLGSAQREDGSE
jgi:hypothetical protein